MPVYDLDKTQEWLNRTMAIRREPPLRGGVRTDFKARRQTLAGVGIVTLMLLLLACLPVRQALVAAAKPVEAPAEVPTSIQPQPVNSEPVTFGRTSTLTEKWLVSLRESSPRPMLDVMPQPFSTTKEPVRSSSQVAPPAPVWLDGQPPSYSH